MYLARHIDRKWFLGMLVLMAATMLSPGSLQAEPEKLSYQQKAMNPVIDEKDKVRKKAFMRILDDHQHIIYKVCQVYRNSWADQQDLFQDIVCHLWEAFPSFRKESGPVTWLYKIALRTAIVPYKRDRSRIELPGELPEVPVETDTRDEEMYAFLQTLEPVDRSIVVLFMEGYTRKEIAVMVGMTAEAVKKRLLRLKKKTNKNL